MAVNVDNLDEVIASMAKMEKAVELEVIREVRKRFRAVMRKLVPDAKGSSPVNTGDLKKSVKIQGRSRRGISKVKLIWRVMYAGPVNFKKDAESSRYATDLWDKKKEPLDQEGSTIVTSVFKEVLEKHGVKVDNK